MPGLSRFSDEEIKRMKRLKEKLTKEKLTVLSRKLLIATDQVIDCAHHMAFESVLRGRPHQLSVSEYIKRKLGFAALGFIDAEVRADREISGRELQKRMQEKLDLNVSISLINRERRRMGWVQTSTRYCQMIRAENREKRLFFALTY